MLSENFKQISKERFHDSVQLVLPNCVHVGTEVEARDTVPYSEVVSSRKQNIEIVGIAQLPGESVKEIVSKIGDKINASSSDIEWARRSRPYKIGTKPPPIIVGFKTTGSTSRDNWLTQRRKLSDITGGSGYRWIGYKKNLYKRRSNLINSDSAMECQEAITRNL
ncbi:unnamed protein product [Leptidea sinapis]|uniref:Uncharacterized protein n=1 Tax=Leptidea sinapis TaxID=189913 RepID=A0A5E4R5U1_9NEOP|nr:unnamed protein product [Leptidea sinapis]